jgi:hypothetical protein
VWGNPEVIAASTDFVAASDEVWRLQRGSDAESRHFQKMAENGHYGGGGGTRQGTYILAPTGRFLASTNEISAERVLEVMAEGLKAWEELPDRERILPADWTLERKRWEDSYPDDGLVLRSFVADLAPAKDRRRTNRDHAWFRPEEARGWLGADPKPGAVHAVSPLIRERLTRFHLVDNVRGQTLCFQPADVEGSVLETRVLSREGEVVTFEITGTTHAQSDGLPVKDGSDWTQEGVYPRSVNTKIMGTGRYDLAAQRFLQMDFVAVGRRTGRTHLNGRTEADVGPADIGWVFEIAPERASERVAPAFIDIYGAAWVVDPR